MVKKIVVCCNGVQQERLALVAILYQGHQIQLLIVIHGLLSKSLSEIHPLFIWHLCDSDNVTHTKIGKYIIAYFLLRGNDYMLQKKVL